jgi:hypothetical protein
MMIGSKFGFTQVSDDFSDGDFTSGTVWSGTTSVFTVNLSEQLQLNNTGPTGSDVSYLATAFVSQSLSEKEWQFWIKQSFAGSVNNYGRFWLASSNGDPTAAGTEGYFLQFGESGSNDAIELFYSNNGATTSVARGPDGTIASGAEMRVRVRRDATGNWTIDIDDNNGYDFIPYASGTNATLSSTDNLGIVCVYTASNATKFSYDDIYFGEYVLDVTPPEVVSVNVVSDTELDVKFSEAVTQATSEATANYTASGGLGTPATATLDGTDPTLVQLAFSTSFVNGTSYELTISNVEDASGNVLAQVIEPFTYVVTTGAAFRDIVINEFMCDPTPTVGLAEAEFVELYNTSSNYIDLTGWKLGDASAFGTIGSHIIGPNEYALLISSASAPLFAFYPNVVVVSSFPSLNNSSDDIILQDTGLVTIDQLSYDISWYRDPNKDDGGYTLEQINPFASCTNASNWIGSAHPLGGTPAAQNSVFDTTPDTIGPSLVGIAITGAQTLELNLNESLGQSALAASNVSVEPALTVVNVSAIAPGNQAVIVSFGTPIDTGVVYTLSIVGMADCEGNPQDVDSVLNFILPFDADSGEFVINEVLFNPFTGGYDYVELVNVTGRPLNLKGWMLASFDEEDGIANHKIISAQNYSVEPGGYVLVTEDTSNVIMNYIQHGIDNFIETDIPSYNNDSGTVYLLTIDSLVSERFAYNEDMHFPLLRDVNGVSLERLDVNRPVDDMGNWHSAAETVGFGTPGIENSQYYPTSGSIGEVSMDPEIFSPDNDGHNDVLNINYSFTSPGFVGTIRIYDSNGRPVRELATNELLGTTGTFTWDGTTDRGEKARIGMYVVLFEAFSTTGESNKYKMSTVLGGRL